MEKQWIDITNNYSEDSRHYNGKYLEKSFLLDEEIEIQIYEVIEDGFDYTHEIFVNCKQFYGSTYPKNNPYELFEQMKEDIYKESFKKNRYSKKFINEFCKKYNLGIAMDSYFLGFDGLFSDFDE